MSNNYSVIEKQIKNNKLFLHLKVITITYIISCSFRLVYDFANLFIITHDVKVGSVVVQESLQPCIILTGDNMTDAILWAVYWWFGYVIWCYGFMYVVWPHRPKFNPDEPVYDDNSMMLMLQSNMLSN